jgi:hypothetical protein
VGSSAFWGHDWTEAFVQTWAINRSDEHDLDVTVTLALSDDSAAVTAYAASKQFYPSPKRGSDATASLRTGATTTLALPNYTYNAQVVYFSLLSATTQTVIATLSKATTAPSLSVDAVPATLAACPGLTSTDCLTSYPTGCTGPGTCIATEEKAFCNCGDWYTGLACETPAFMGSASIPANPAVVISNTWKALSPFDANAVITVPYEVRSAPAHAVVRIKVDGKAWPTPNTGMYYVSLAGTPESGQDTYKTVSVSALAPDVEHTIAVHLSTADDTLLGVAQAEFKTVRVGSCAPDANGVVCGGYGLCHSDGYCVCYDGHIGAGCTIADATAGSALSDAPSGTPLVSVAAAVGATSLAGYGMVRMVGTAGYGGYTLRSLIEAPLVTREVLPETYFLLVIMAANAQARPFLQFQASC